ncbi:hypothetical protein HHK36_033364 [Tetracentron sinense]|uniref:Uncharacterized protein n=1 Tax=Tetracentron sinense TaxID=13715 RepID=A0A835CZM0_TETSI|nr:hypothetical protein HHK36_033364 [Tetracentron sinense]
MLHPPVEFVSFYTKWRLDAHRSLLKFPEVILPEDLFVTIALSLRDEFNQVLATFKEVASGKDCKKFLVHEDHVDTFAEKAIVEINKHYAMLDEKVL